MSLRERRLPIMILVIWEEQMRCMKPRARFWKYWTANLWNSKDVVAMVFAVVQAEPRCLKNPNREIKILILKE